MDSLIKNRIEMWLQELETLNDLDDQDQRIMTQKEVEAKHIFQELLEKDLIQ